MAGDNTIGWQDKQAYRAKLTIAKAAVKNVRSMLCELVASIDSRVNGASL